MTLKGSPERPWNTSPCKRKHTQASDRQLIKNRSGSIVSYVYWYSLESDADDPLIPEGCYRAPTQSRWNTPEFMAIFADTVRKIAILQTTQHMWKGNAPKWRIDMQAICNAKVQHFEKLTAILARHGQQSMQEMMRAAAEHKLLPLFKALQYITFQTANIPLTQGYKVGLRQLGFALNIYDGPLTIFLTTNFADIYSPITVTLMNGAGNHWASEK